VPSTYQAVVSTVAAEAAEAAGGAAAIAPPARRTPTVSPTAMSEACLRRKGA